MKKITAFIFAAATFLACNNKTNSPDVSRISIKLNLDRFEKSFFSIDTNNLGPGLIKVHADYPDFYPDFMQNIMGVSGNPSDTATLAVLQKFLSSYSSFAKEIEIKYQQTADIEARIKNGFQYVKYYFPSYKIPGLITYLGPLDAPGVALTRTRIAIGLQQYAGKDFPGYQSREISQMYPDYISRRFDRLYIPANCMKIVVEDLFPDKTTGKPLIEQMIEKGKQWWLLDKLMPGTPDSLKTGYSQKQLDWCKLNEGLIWNYFTTNENLETIEPDVIQNYIGESPSTQGMPASSPGNIGQWIGWQIAKKFADKNSALKPEEVMTTSARRILAEAKYKPK